MDADLQQEELFRAKSVEGEDLSPGEVLSHLKSRLSQLLYGALVYIVIPIILVLMPGHISFYQLIALLWGITQLQFAVFIVHILITGKKLHQIISIQKKLDGFGDYMWYTTKIKSLKHVPVQSICGFSSTRGSSMDRVFAISLLLSLGFGISGCLSKLVEYDRIYDTFNIRICSVIVMCIAQYLYLCIYFIQTRESGKIGNKLHKYFSWTLTPLTPLTFLLHQHGSVLSICLFVTCFLIGIMNKITAWMSGFDNNDINNTEQSVNKWSKIYLAVELILFIGCGVCAVLFFCCLDGDVVL